MRLIALITLLAGGLSSPLVQGIGPLPKPAAPQTKPIEPLIGTLDIAAPRPDEIYNFRRDGKGFAGWFFINGELRGTMPLRQRFLVTPGVYQLRGVVALRNNAGVFFRTVTWPRVAVMQGQTVTLDVTPHFTQFPHRDGATEVKDWVEPSIEFPNYRLDPANPDAFFTGTAAAMDNGWKAYLEEGPFKGVLAALRRLQEAPPSRARVWIDVVDRYGGPREFDVPQLRALHEAIKPNIGNWGTIGYLYPRADDPALRLRARAHVDALSEQNEKYRQYVSGVFDALVAALEKAGGR